MDIVVTGLHTEVPERFRRHVEDKLAKIEQLSPRVQGVHVVISHESNPRQADTCERVELTVKAKGPVIRAEASADDPYAALDLAQEKLMERLRRLRDRGKVHHGRRQPPSVRVGDGLVGVVEPEPVVDEADELGESPIVIREKTHAGPPMSVQDALDHMELVGHDFYLFCDTATGKPSVVYRRRGWSYGVLRLETTEAEAHGADHAGENGRGGAAQAAAAIG